MKRANASFGAMGSMILVYEFQAMSAEDKATIVAAATAKNISFKTWRRELDADFAKNTSNLDATVQS